MNSNDWLKAAIDKIENKVDQLDQKIDAINVRHERNTVILEEHQRRSLANEKQVEILKEELNKRISPLEGFATKITGALKFVGLISVLVGIAASATKVVEFILSHS